MTSTSTDRRLPTEMVTIWWVVNAVALSQAVGFMTRLWDPSINRAIGFFIAALAIPATWALVRLVRARSEPGLWLGPILFDLFVGLMLWVDVLAPVEFRSPPRPAILVPYLVSFFGSIVLMGAPMFRLDRRRWAVTALSSGVLLVAMVVAIAAGVG